MDIAEINDLAKRGDQKAIAELIARTEATEIALLTLRESAVLAVIRLGLCGDRMRGCNDFMAEKEKDVRISEKLVQHELIDEVENWQVELADAVHLSKATKKSG